MLLVDIYRIQTSMTLGGNLAPELASMLKAMASLEKNAKGVEKAIGKWSSPVDRAASSVDRFGKSLSGAHRSASGVEKELVRISRAMSGLKGTNGGLDRDFARMAAALGKPIVEMKTMRSETQGVASAARGITSSISGWTSKINSAVSAIKRMQAAAQNIHMPTVPRTGGGAGYTGAGRGHGSGHGFGAHQARGVAGTYPALGAPTASVHYLEEILAQAGGVDQVAEIQRTQGGMIGGRAMSAAELGEEIQKNKAAAFAVAGSQRYTDPLQNMKTITDLADLGKGDYAEARHLLPAFAKMNFTTSLIGDEDIKSKMQEKGQSRYLARALDQMGVMAKPEAEQDKYFKAFTTGAVGTRGIFDGRQLFGAVSKSGGTATGWSPEFVAGALPMLVEQMTGSGVGDASYMLSKHMLKGQMSNKAETAEMLGLGLQSKSNLKSNGKDFQANSVIGSDVLKRNPFEWFEKYFIPALEKKGITSKEDQDAKINDLTFAKNYAKMFHEFLENRDNIKSNITRFSAQGDTQGLIDNTMGGQLNMLTQGLKTFGTAMADPEVGNAISVLRDVGQAVSGLGKALHENPGAAQGTFAGVAALGGGIAAAGGAAVTIAAVSALSLPALTIGSITALTIGTFLFPWDKLYDAMGWKPGIAVGGKTDNGVTSNPSDMLPGVPSEGKGPYDIARDKARAAGTQGLGLSPENVTAAIEAANAALGRTSNVAPPAATGLEKVSAAAGGIPGALDAVAAAISGFIARLNASAVAGPPAAAPGKQSSVIHRGGAAPIHVATSVHLDSRVVGRSVTRHQVAEANTRNGTGLFDDNSLKTPVGYSGPTVA
ncbi:hypothetical protein MKK55_19065 [Methylobacterium sp. J-059]|uniref:hypothetical protein n=1 Tax=Methylobacterium sp. J-059 TaxID=2836643 RepID=UPI001FB94783|nr:hypothetical protein [Methylobacterium sp. J-059]MCJ2041033.1 hypothetical protein [Methylobacterium sp. J-059]